MPKDDWEVLGQGTYNVAYKSKNGKEVLKIQKGSDESDTPERSVRLWNAINAHVPPPARLLKTEYGWGWVCPFIKGVQASDKEMAGALIDIFNNTGRVVVDATAPKNFVRTPDGQVLCVDVGMALQFERREEIKFAEIRRKSVVSLNTWSDLKDDYKPFLKQCALTNPETVNVVKALVFIKYNRPDIYDTNFLKTNPELVSKLANAYDKMNVVGTLAHLDMAVKPATFAIPEDKVQFEVQSFVRYLRSRGSPFVIADDKVTDMSLSARYGNSSDSNKPYVNIEIRNPDVALLFNQYVTEQAQLAQQRLAQERLEQKKQPQVKTSKHDLIADYTRKKEIINTINRIINDSPNLSKSEKRFITRSCTKLVNEINLGIKEINSAQRPQEKQIAVEKKIKQHLNDMSTEAKKIPRTSGLRGFINDVFEAFGVQKPFNITESKTIDTVMNMKSQLSTIKDTETSPDPSSLKLL